MSRKGERIIANYLADLSGMEVGVMLFELEGALNSLEVYSHAGSDTPFGLPEIATCILSKSIQPS
jgi:hypothetical protein